MLEKAAALGFHTYCLSEHVPRQFDNELYPEEIQEGSTPASLLAKYRAYLEEARRLQKLQREDGINVLVGAETENVSPDTLQWLKAEVFGTKNDAGSAAAATGAAVGKGVVDYLVGSVHHAGAFLPCCSSLATIESADAGIPIDFDAATFERARFHFEATKENEGYALARTASLLRLCLSYFDAQYKLINELRPEVIGHFDLVRLFAPDLKIYAAEEFGSEPITGLRKEVAAAADRNIRLAASYGALFEVNSASVRKGWPSPYPADDVMKVSPLTKELLFEWPDTDGVFICIALQRIIRLGGRLCLSDDAHGPSHVAINYRESRDYLRSHGIDAIWYLALDQEDLTPQEDEIARQSRENSDSPGRDAPRRFARGTKAVKVEQWWKDNFWTRLDGDDS